MAGTDFNVKLVTDLKALREMRKEMDKTAKEVKKQFDKQINLEGKYNKQRKRELQMHRRLALGSLKDELNYHKDIQKVKSGERSKEWAYQRKYWREQKRVQREQTRWRRQEQRDIEKVTFGQRARGGFRTAGRAMAGLGGGLLGMFIGGAQAAYGKHVQVAQASQQVMGLSRNGRFNMNLLPSANTYGFNKAEAMGQAALMGRATGVLGPRELQQTMRATGVAVGEGAEMFSALRQAGYGFQGGETTGSSTGKRELEKIFAGAFHSGLTKAQFPQYAKGVFNIVRQVGSRTAGTVDVGSINAFMTALGKTGRAGFQGERGAAVAATLDTAFKQQGGAGGEWGKGLFLRAMGFGKPGGNTDYFDARLQMAKGISGKGNVEALLGQALAEAGGSTKEGALQLEAATGMGLDQAYALIKDFESGKLDVGKAEKLLKPKESFEERAGKAMEDMGVDLKHIASRFDEFAGLGKDWSDEIQALEDAQMKLFGFLSDFAKDAIPVLKDMYYEIKDLVAMARDWFKGQGVSVRESKKEVEAAEAAMKAANEATTIEEKQALIKDAIDAANRGGKIYAGSMSKAEALKEGIFEGIDFITDPTGINPLGTNLSKGVFGDLAKGIQGQVADRLATEIQEAQIRLNYAKAHIARSQGAITAQDIPMETEMLMADMQNKAVQAQVAQAALTRQGLGPDISKYTAEDMEVFNRILEALNLISSNTDIWNNPTTNPSAPKGPTPPASN